MYLVHSYYTALPLSRGCKSKCFSLALPEFNLTMLLSADMNIILLRS